MAKVLTIHFTEKARIPTNLTPEQAAGFKQAIEKALAANPTVKFEGIFVNADGIGYGMCEAPSADDVKKVVEQSGATADIITVVAPLKL